MGTNLTEGFTIFGIRLGVRWEDGVIPFTIDRTTNGGIFAGGNMDLDIANAIRHWERNTRIRFVQRTTHRDFVTFQLANPGDDCFSAVGRTGWGQQIIGLELGCRTPQIIHEIGHAVGLWHEQSRPDRDSFVTILWDNIQPRARHNFEIRDGVQIGAYDHASIMHYRRNEFALPGCGCDTIQTIPPGIPIGTGTVLSAGDIAAVEQIYGWTPPPPTGWSGWQRLGNPEHRGLSLAVERNEDGRLEVFLIGTALNAWHNWQLPIIGTWSGWYPLGGSGAAGDKIGAARNQDGRLEVFVRGTDGALWHIGEVSPGGGWSGWASLGGTLTSGVAVVPSAEGALWAFVRGSDQGLYHKRQVFPNGEWTPDWAYLGGTIGHFTANRNTDGRIVVFATTPAGEVYLKSRRAEGAARL